MGLAPGLCIDAMKDTELCYKGVGGLLFPMMVAAYLLLATASIVLLCTMLRCCCRCICNLPPSTQLGEDATQSEDEVGTEDDEYIVTPLPSGVKQEKAQEEEDENALPGYTEVVEGAAVLPRAPLQTFCP